MYEDLADRILRKASSLGIDFVEARFEDTVYETLLYVNGRVMDAGINRINGVGIKVLVNGSMGFASTSRLEANNVLNTLEEALRIAKTLGEGGRRVSEVTLSKGEYSIRGVQKHPASAEWNEKLDLVKRMHDYAREKGMQSVVARYGAYYGIIEVYTSDGIKVANKPLLTGLGVNVVSREDGKIGDGSHTMAGSVGLEAFSRDNWLPETIAEKAVSMSREKIRARPPPAGELVVVIKPRMAGVFAHESFGHLSEGDNIATGTSPLAGRLGEKIASEAVTIVDTGVDERGGVKLLVDDEGVQTRKAVLVEKGVLKGYLLNRETAAALGTESTGNGRAQSFRHDPIVRMRNTFFEAGDWSEEEIISDTKRGVLVDQPRGGQVDLDGTFTFTASIGYVIENGELKEPIRDVVLAGNILEMLKYVDAASRNVEIFTSPFGGCGKWGQRAFVGLGGPTLRATKLLVGGRGE